MAILQGQLFTLFSFLDMKGNTTSILSLRVLSEQLVAINIYIAVVGIIPPGFSNGNYTVFFQWYGDFKLLLFISQAACTGVETVQLGNWPCRLLGGELLNSF